MWRSVSGHKSPKRWERREAISSLDLFCHPGSVRDSDGRLPSPYTNKNVHPIAGLEPLDMSTQYGSCPTHFRFHNDIITPGCRRDKSPSTSFIRIVAKSTWSRFRTTFTANGSRSEMHVNNYWRWIDHQSEKMVPDRCISHHGSCVVSRWAVVVMIYRLRPSRNTQEIQQPYAIKDYRKAGGYGA